MSHIAAYKTKIKVNPLKDKDAKLNDPTWQLLKAAVEATADEIGGEVTDTIIDYYGTRQPCEFAIVTPDFKRGVGIDVSPIDGRVSFAYDSYGDRPGICERVTQLVTQNYTAMAVARALKEMHYEVDYDESRDQRYGEKMVLIRGVM